MGKRLLATEKNCNWKKPLAKPDSVWASASTGWGEQGKMGKRREVGGKEGVEKRER